MSEFFPDPVYARLEENKKSLVAERDRLLALKKENRLKIENQTREESDLAKVRIL